MGFILSLSIFFNKYVCLGKYFVVLDEISG